MKSPNSLKTASLLACLVTAPHIHAQSSVTLYGIMDAGVRTASGLDPSNVRSAGNANMLNSGINTTSRLGFRGTEDLGGGLSALFFLESGLNINNGTTSNTSKFFDRGSFTGLKGDLGTLTVGRQNTLLSDAIFPVDPLATRFAGLNPNVALSALSSHQLGAEYGASGSSTGTYRLDNSAKYAYSFGNTTARVMHAFGNQADSNSKLSSNGASLDYRSNVLQATVAYHQFKTATNLTLNGFVSGIAVPVAAGKLNITYSGHTADTSTTAKTTNKILGLGGTWPLTPQLDLLVSHYRVNRSRTANADDGYNRTIAFLEYKLSTRSLVYLEADSTQWKNAYQGAGLKSSSTGLSAGIKHTF
ncbi:porin [Curvibacter lanceolatus]|uniref:porin n=1 Tax=Curvibacter lanceolatus TaxID=86182 RepID=UPI00036B8468|nr:porin [Curvibacter lanceolatus]